MTDQVLLGGAGFILQVVPVSTEQVNLGEQLNMLTSRHRASEELSPLSGRCVGLSRPTCCICCCSCSFWAGFRWSLVISGPGVIPTGVMALLCLGHALACSWLVTSCRALLCCRLSHCLRMARRRAVSISTSGVSKLHTGSRPTSPPPQLSCQG